MPKSRDAFRTISEVAEWLDTPAHVLRFWESKFTQVKPVKRAGGRRYYRPADMELLAGIKKLLHEDGMTIKGVQKVLREQGVRHVSTLSGMSADADGDAGELIEDAPYTEVAVEEATDTLIQFPQQAVAQRSEPELEPEPEPEAAEPVMAEAAMQDDPEDVAQMAPAEEAAEAMDQPPEDDAPAPQEDEPEAVEPPMVEAVPAEAVADSPEDPAVPDAPQVETAPEEDAPLAAADLPEPPPESPEAEPVTAEPEPEAPAPDIAAETPAETTPVDASEAEVEADPVEVAAEHDTPEPAAVPVAPELPLGAPPARTRPIDLPDFDAPRPAARAAPRPPQVPDSGALTRIAAITALSEPRRTALAAHLPALEALRDRLSAPLD
ncbi:MerR family transcriptional regulator [Maliponia aquimaris]|uniref:MerR family regulatory protein n=1 Tax=Maliponia aquimaris TaxID=1673631 RepID=A0A238KRI1_9RHOB|nr:MerR family transcriptional regulator [Maliponia aquimaris]SMX45260.1 MerR family regulatory protein [Maliponia aquimaris]